MAPTVFAPSIRSRPVYGTLLPRAGSAHLMVADGDGALAVLALLHTDPALTATARVVFIPRGTGHAGALQARRPAQLHVSPSFAAALPRLRKLLADAHMGTQIYAAGTEGLIGQTLREAMAAGLPHSALQAEHRGSLARRVQCVHCKGITEDVVTDPFACTHCGLNLFVRDHYSRRIAAFQGVNIDAEDPGRVPAAAVRFT